jgi:hypothetical protein
MATAAWSLRAPPLYSGATDTPFGLIVLRILVVYECILLESCCAAKIT